MQIKYYLVALTIFLCGSIAQADLIISEPKVNNREVRKIEAGATVSLKIEYKNTSNLDRTIARGQIQLKYDPDVIDELLESTIENQSFAPGKFVFLIEKPRRVQPNETITLTNLTFHLNQTTTQANKWLYLLTWGGTDSCKLYENELDVTGRLNYPQQKYLEESKPPEFIGLSEATSANSFGEKDPGNTILLDWRTPAGAFDLTKFMTPRGELLSFRVYRSCDGTNWEELSVPGNPVYTGNLENVPFVYEDKDLENRRTYYYKVTAIDNTSPVPNEQTQVAVLSAIPYNFSVPGQVSNVIGLTHNNTITLRWKNPEDPDLSGIMIIRNEESQVAEGKLISATVAANGREYQFGEEPFGTGKGMVVFYSFPEDYSHDLVPIEHIDYEALPETKYFYKIFTYDRAKNYSEGIPLGMTTEGPIEIAGTLPQSLRRLAEDQGKITDRPLVFPNPFRPTGNNNVTFQYTLNKNLNVDIIISDTFLKLVKKINCYVGEEGGKEGLNKINWDGKNEQGAIVSNGPHLVNIFSRDTHKVIGRIRLTVYR
ncbi:MAG: hypothetical protein ABIH69_02510 [bacterium]|nr:hypothetical protein [Candidatus Margulisiibacteriota bacterium]